MEEEAIQSAASDLGLVLQTDSGRWMRELIEGVNDMLVNDFNRLIAILYRLDVSDRKLRERLADSPKTDAARLIAEMMVEREVRKIKSRRETRRDDISSIDEDERW